MSPISMARVSTALAFLGCAGCGAPAERIAAGPVTPLNAGASVAEDSAPKNDLRLVPPEAYMRTYLQIFGGLVPMDAQKRARGGDGAQIFDTWDDYVSALGLPDYRLDIPRQVQTNALMVATFERLGIALCDRAVEHDLMTIKGAAPPPIAQRLVFAFDAPPTVVDAQGFAPRFDVLHRTFLGYPAAMAPPDRMGRFFQLYQDTAAGHAKADPKSRFNPTQAAWAAVCYGLVRHPEFHLY